MYEQDFYIFPYFLIHFFPSRSGCFASRLTSVFCLSIDSQIVVATSVRIPPPPPHPTHPPGAVLSAPPCIRSWLVLHVLLLLPLLSSPLLSLLSIPFLAPSTHPAPFQRHHTFARSHLGTSISESSTNSSFSMPPPPSSPSAYFTQATSSSFCFGFSTTVTRGSSCPSAMRPFM